MSDPLPRIRVIDLETAGNGPHDVCEIGWQDVEPGCGRPLAPERGVRITPGQSRPPDRTRDYGGPPHSRRPGQRGAILEDGRAGNPATGSAEWICTWKGALRVWPELPSFSNQMLRYVRRPAGLVHEMGLPAHRALPDAYVTVPSPARHAQQGLSRALLAWSREPGLLPRVPAGADRGKAFRDLGDEALRALMRERHLDIRFSAEIELQRRGEAPPAAAPPGQQRLLGESV